MCTDVITLLKDDHRRFAGLFLEIANQCDRAEDGVPVDNAILNAIVSFLRDRALPVHHALEEAIFIMLLRNFPQIREIYDLAEDHQQSNREFDAFVDAVTSTKDSFVDVARSYIGNERAHFIAEEEVLFPYAKRYLRQDQWNDLKNTLRTINPNATEPLDPVIARFLQST